MGKVDFPLVLQAIGNLVGTGTLTETKSPTKIEPIHDHQPVLDGLQFSSMFGGSSKPIKKSELPLVCPGGETIGVPAKAVTAEKPGLLSLIDDMIINDLGEQILHKCNFDYRCNNGERLPDAFK